MNKSDHRYKRCPLDTRLLKATHKHLLEPGDYPDVQQSKGLLTHLLDRDDYLEEMIRVNMELEEQIKSLKVQI